MSRTRIRIPRLWGGAFGVLRWGNPATSIKAGEATRRARAELRCRDSERDGLMPEIVGKTDVLMSADHADLSFRIEVQAGEIRAIAHLEEQVERGRLFVANHGRSADNEELCDMEGIFAHRLVGVPLQSTIGAIEAKHLTGPGFRSSQEKHRNKINGSIMPSLLSCKPVSRSDSINNKDAMDAYWKEWHNIDEKNVVRYETLCEWDDASRKTRTAREEINLGYLLRFMVKKVAGFPFGDPRRIIQVPNSLQGQ